MRLPDTGRSCHPKVRSSSIRHYLFDEIAAISATSSPAKDIVRGAVLDTIATYDPPIVVRGCTPRARRFATEQGLAEASADADLIEACKGEGTFGVLFRNIHTTGNPSGPLWSVSGTDSDASSTTNFLRSMRLNSSGQLVVEHEHSTGTDVTSTFTGFAARTNEWVYLVLRVVTATAGDGPTGTVTLKAFCNGAPILDPTTGNPQSFTVANASGGSAAVLRIGHDLDSGGTPKNVKARDIAGFYAWAEALTDDEIAEDARRIRLRSFDVRTDAMVRVFNIDGAPVNLADIEDTDFVDSISISKDLDTSTDRATLELGREEQALSLAFLKTESKLNLSDVTSPTSYLAPLIRDDGEIEIFAATIPIGLTASLNEFWASSRFKGRIDEVDDANGDGAIMLDCRDQGGVFVDTMIEQEIEYGDEPALPAEDEIQRILNDNDNDNTNDSVATTDRDGSYDPVTLEVVGAPQLNLIPWRQRREPVLTALKTIANISAWDVRFVFAQSPYKQDWRLTYYQPDFDRKDVDAVISPDDVLDVTSLKRSTFGRRTNVRIIYPSTETSLPTPPTPPAGYSVSNGWYNVDGDGNRMVAYLDLQSDTAIALTNKRQFMEVQEQQTSQISTVDEAYVMAMGLLRSVEDPGIAKSVTLRGFIDVELNDMLRFQPIKHLFTVAQNLSVKNISETIGDDVKTEVQLRGIPSLGWKRLLQLESRPGQGRPGVIDPNQALTDWSTGSMLQVARNLLDRTSYFTGGKFTQIRNPDFASFSAGLQNPPDGWTMLSGFWGTNVVVVSGIQLSGQRAIRLVTDGSALMSDLIPVIDDIHTPYSCEASWQWPTGASALPVNPKRLQILVLWYAADKTTLVQSRIVRPGASFATSPGYQPPDVTIAADTWFRLRVDGISPPGGAKFVRIALSFSTNASQTANSGGIAVDNVSFYRTAREDRTYALSGFGPTSSGVWVCINLRRAAASPVFGTHDYGHNHFANATSLGSIETQREDGTFDSILVGGTVRAGAGFYCRESGTYFVTVQALLKWRPTGAFTDFPVGMARVVLNGSYFSVADMYNSGVGTVVAQSASSAWVLSSVYDPSFGFTAGTYVASVSLSFRVELSEGDRLSLEYFADSVVGGDVSPVHEPSHTWWNVRLGLAE